MKLTTIFDKKFFKFILVGTINTIVGSAIMFSLYNIAHLSYWVSSACNYFFDYFLNSKPQNIRENVALFAGMCLFTGLNYLGQRFVVFAKNKNGKT